LIMFVQLIPEAKPDMARLLAVLELTADIISNSNSLFSSRLDWPVLSRRLERPQGRPSNAT
jgi:hypothetical protein